MKIKIVLARRALTMRSSVVSVGPRGGSGDWAGACWSMPFSPGKPCRDSRRGVSAGGAAEQRVTLRVAFLGAEARRRFTRVAWAAGFKKRLGGAERGTKTAVGDVE